MSSVHPSEGDSSSLPKFQTFSIDEDFDVDDSVKKMHSGFNFTTGGKEFRLRTTYWRKKAITDDKDFKATVFLCHGYSEYMSKSWDGIATALALRGFLVFGHDHLGHGMSDGERVQTVVSFKDDMVAPCLLHCKMIRKSHQKIEKMFIIGHSMGGLLAGMSVVQEPELFQGAVFMGAAVEVDPNEATPLKRCLAKVFCSLLPGVQIGGLDLHQVTQVAESRQMIESDPLFWHGGIKVKFGANFMKAQDEFESQMGLIKLPVFIQHGDKDTLTPLNGAKTLMEKVGSTDKELKIYKGAYHDMYVEPEEIREAVINDECEWIEARC